MLIAGALPFDIDFGVDPLETPDLTLLPQLRRVQFSGILRVGVSADMPPFAFRDPNTGEFRGFEVDMAKRLAQAIFGCAPASVMSHLHFEEVVFAERELMLLQHEVDIVVAVFADTPERRRRLHFAGHYMAGKPALLAGPNCPDIASIEDMNPTRIAVLAGSTNAARLREIAPAADGVTFESTTECVNAVRAGTVEGYFSTIGENVDYLHEVDSPFREIRLPLPSEPWGFAVSKSAEASGRFINDLISQMITDGSLARMKRHWLGTHAL